MYIYWILMPKVSIQGGRKRKHLRAKKEKNTTGDTSHRWAKQNKIPPEINALSFYVTKTDLVGQKWLWSDQIDLDLAIMIWWRPKWNGHDQNELVRSKLWFSTKMNHIWTWPIHFGRDHFILFVTKSLWSSPNQFGQIKTILDRPKLFWSHRRTRH